MCLVLGVIGIAIQLDQLLRGGSRFHPMTLLASTVLGGVGIVLALVETQLL